MTDTVRIIRKITEPTHSDMGPREHAELTAILDAAQPRVIGGRGTPEAREPGEAEAYAQIGADASLSSLSQRPPLEEALDVAPAEWAAVLAKVEAATVAAEDARPARVEAAWTEARAALIAAARAAGGKPVKGLPVLADAQATAEAVAGAALDAARQARRDYQRAAAAQKLDSAAEAGRLVAEQGQRVTDALVTLAAAQEQLAEAMGLMRSVDTSKVAITPLPAGAYTGALIDTGVVEQWKAIDWASVVIPEAPVMTHSERRIIASTSRMQMGKGWPSAMIHLARLEHGEDYKISAHTRNMGVPLDLDR